jgi:hypothetical protein
MPKVPASSYTEQFDGDQAPPAEEVANAVDSEPEIKDLFSLAGGAVIGEIWEKGGKSLMG